MTDPGQPLYVQDTFEVSLSTVPTVATYINFVNPITAVSRAAETGPSEVTRSNVDGMGVALTSSQADIRAIQAANTARYDAALASQRYTLAQIMDMSSRVFVANYNLGGRLDQLQGLINNIYRAKNVVTDLASTQRGQQAFAQGTADVAASQIEICSAIPTPVGCQYDGVGLREHSCLPPAPC